ncbi:uncharacterized protein LOC120342843 [Styela clava]
MEANNKKRKMSIKRTESQISNHSVKWKDPVLSPTFHDVQIEQVHIVEPSTGIVTFNEAQSIDRHSAGDRSSAGLKMVAPPPSEEGSLGTNSDDRQVFRDNYLYDPNKRVPSGLIKIVEGKRPMTDSSIRWANPEHPSTVPLVNLPLEPLGTAIPRDRSVHTRQQSRQQSSAAEQRHRQKIAIIRHMQRLQTGESPQQRRLVSGGTKKRQRERYYEVAPGVILTELPPDEHPQTAPSNEYGYGLNEEIIDELYNGRAKTVPHVTKSIIWTAKNRIASSRAVSSNSSRWRNNELMDIESNRKANVFIKMPFKQSPFITMNPEKQEMIDDIVRPGYELRLTTAFTISRVKRGLKLMNDPINIENNKAGKLLKGRLKPLCPVKLPGPTIRKCQGIQPEAHVQKKSEGYTPSPSRQRQLKDRLNKAYEEHRSRKAEYERRMIRAQSATSRESVHRTSPEPSEYANILDQDIILNERTGLDENYSVNDNMMSVSNQLDSMHIESGVIF